MGVNAGPPPWEAWAPKLDPPTSGGLPYDEAAAIAAVWWDEDPHEAAALMWEAYAARLDPTPAVSMVNTGPLVLHRPVGAAARGGQGRPGEPGAELVAGMTLLLATGPISVA
jgi:hypothetical protein